MLGAYDDFPRNVQKTAHFAFSISNKGLQRALLQACHKLNAETLDLKDLVTPSIPQCNVIFELGIADGDGFNFLDNEETNKLLKLVDKQPLQMMDFLYVIRYYKTDREKKTPLRFDHYMLRFVFDKGLAEMRVFHEKGPMHVSPDEVVDFITHKTNALFSKKVLKPVDAA
jgi:hypothetical protein